MSNPVNNLSPEMQARLAAIMAGQVPGQGAQPSAPAPGPTQEVPNQPAPAAQQAPAQQPAPVVRPPSLMDHVIALRQEVAMLRQSVAANSDVVEAVGQAVGQLYQMFQPSAQGNPQGTTYSQGFQQQKMVDDSDY